MDALSIRWPDLLALLARWLAGTFHVKHEQTENAPLGVRNAGLENGRPASFARHRRGLPGGLRARPFLERLLIFGRTLTKRMFILFIQPSRGPAEGTYSEARVNS